MTPFEAGGNAQVNVQVVQNGVAGPPVAVGVKAVAAYPDILAVLNPNGTLNSQFNPAHPGDTVVVYATGFGDTKPSGQDGALYRAPFPVPLYPVSMYYDENVSLAYAAPAPGIVEGIWQLNLAFSKDAATGLSNLELGRVHTIRSASTISAKQRNARNTTSSFSKREKMRRKPLRRRNSRSISLRFVYKARSYSRGCSRLDFGGTTGTMPRSSTNCRVSLPS